MENRLLKKLYSRHARTQRKVYEEHCDRLMHIVLRYVKDIPYAEEVLQDVFIQIFDKIIQYDINRGTFKNWTHRIAVTQSLMKLRKLNSEKYKFSDIIESRNMISNEGMQNLNYADLLEKVEALSPKQSALIKLRLIEGYEFQEISELLNISVSNSRKILSRARNVLGQDINSSIQANQL